MLLHLVVLFLFFFFKTVTLSIPGNKLSGTLSTSIGLLRNLEYLDLSNNNLSGDVPSELALLTKLRKCVNMSVCKRIKKKKSGSNNEENLLPPC